MKSQRHTWLPIVLLIGLVSAWIGPATVAQDGLPEEAPRTDYVQVASPDLDHPATNSRATDDGEPTSTHFAEIADAPREPETDTPRTIFHPPFYQQGDYEVATRNEELAIPPKPKRPPALDAHAAKQTTNAGVISQNFDGISATNWNPPDTVLAVGPKHVLEAVNSQVAIYEKTGKVAQAAKTFDSFFSSQIPVGWRGYLFDPRVMYSQTHGQYLVLMLGSDSTAKKSYVFIGISKTNDPTGAWWLYRLDANPGTMSGYWLDFAGLGADKWGLYVTGNYYSWSGHYYHSFIWSIGPDVFSGGTAKGKQFTSLTWPSGSSAFAVEPAYPQSVDSNEATYFVNTYPWGGNKVLLWKLTGDRTKTTALTRTAVTVPAYSAVGQHITQPGKGSTVISGGDNRLSHAVYSQGKVYWTTATDPKRDGSASGALVVKLDVTTNTKEWSDLIYSGKGSYYFFPAVAVNGGTSATPEIGVVGNFAYAKANLYPSGFVKVYTDPHTNDDGPFKIFAGGTHASNKSRWGDYSMAYYDWSSSPASLWGSVEYPASNGSWKTRIVEVTFE